MRLLIISQLILCILIQRVASVACMSACMRILILSTLIRCTLLASILHVIQIVRQPAGPLSTRAASWIWSHMPQGLNSVSVLLFLFLHHLHPFQHIRFVPISGHIHSEKKAIKRGASGRGRALNL